MKTTLAFLMLLLLPGLSLGQSCGKERWPVKTLHDLDAADVIKTKPILTTISQLMVKTAPPRSVLEKAETKRYPDEMKVYELHVLVVGYKKEADSDFHIVISDSRNRAVTMIVEIPSGNCTGRIYQKMFNDLQSEFAKEFSKPGKYKKLKTPVAVDVVGVGFFDFIHGQTGVAKNGFELHPVLSLKKEN